MKTWLIIFVFCGQIYSMICDQYYDDLWKKLNKTSLDSTTLSPGCYDDVSLYLKKLNYTIEDEDEDENFWALQMFDSTTKLPSGLLSYNFGELGNFQQCIDIQSKSDKILGKYCLGNVVVNQSAIHGGSSYLQNHVYLWNLMLKVAEGHKLVDNPSWAMCLPSNCTEVDAIQLMDMSDTLGLRVSSVTCQTKNDANPELDASAIFGITVFSTLILIIIISTVLDAMNQRKEKTLHPILTSFSLNKNCKTLFTIPRRNSSLTCLDGLRVISMLWILTLHVYQTYEITALINSKDLVNFTDSLISMLFYNGNLGCDTFLLIGGILVTYVFFKNNEEETMTITKILKHYFHRYIRLTPAVIGLLLFHISVVKYLDYGPNWPTMMSISVEWCQKYWWSSLLYVQNYVNPDEMCMAQTWYLNVDMQLYLLSPFIFWILKKSPRIGISVLVLAALASMAISFTKAYLNELSAITNTHYLRVPLQIYVNQYYLKTETRATPWLFGALLGYILTKKNRISQLSKIQLVCFWVLNLSVMVICVLGGHSTLRLPEYRHFENAIAIALIRPFFSVAVGCIIWACATDQGGIINKFLSHPIFQFLNKFTLSIYLLHVTFMHMVLASKKSSIYFSVLQVVFDVGGVCIYIFGLSIIWILVFEIPMVEIEKIIFSK